MELRTTLSALKAKSVGLALDMDESGWAASNRLVAELHEAYGLGLFVWDERHKGIDDAIVAGVEPECLTEDALHAYLEGKSKPTLKPLPSVKVKSDKPITLMDGLHVLTTPWPEPQCVVPDVLPVGLSLIAGKSKIGKSFLVLDLAISVATGTNFLRDDWVLPQGKVLYLALEDPVRNLARRGNKLMQGREDRKELLKKNLVLGSSSSNVPRMPGGMIWLREKILERDEYKLVIIDTLERFRPEDTDGKGRSYSGDYALLCELKSWAEDHGLAVLLVHHTRKGGDKDLEDMFDTVLGSTGLLGAPDTLLLLQRDREKDTGKLVASGREIQHVSLPLNFDREQARWRMLLESADEDNGSTVTPSSFLKELLGDGKPMLKTDIDARAKTLGFGPDALKRAKSSLGNIEAKKSGRQWVWQMLLPKPLPSALEDELIKIDEAFQKALDEQRYEDAAELKRRREEIQSELDKRKGDVA